MKRTALISKPQEMNCILIRHGANHDWYQTPSTGVCQPIPRHREINEKLARHIINMLSN